MRDFNGAITMWAEFEQKHAGTEVAEAAAGHRRELRREFYARFDRDMRVADAKYKKGNIEGALYDYEKIQKYGDEDMKRKAADQMAALERSQASSERFSMRSVWIAGGRLGRISGAHTVHTGPFTSRRQGSARRRW